MANKPADVVKVDKEIFIGVLKCKGCSIRQLDDPQNTKGIDRTEKTIRRHLDKGAMPYDLLDKIAQYIDVNPNWLSGNILAMNENMGEDYVHKIKFLIFRDPEPYPWLEKVKDSVDYCGVFSNLLALNDIRVEQFQALDVEKRVQCRKDVTIAILDVFSRYFDKDSNGNDLAYELKVCKAILNGIDPTGYYEQLEGIGYSDGEYENLLTPKEQAEHDSAERKFMDIICRKYGI